VIVDEASFVQDNVLNDNILPMIFKDERTGIFLSSPLEETNPRSMFFRASVEGSSEPIFETVNLSVICPRCAEARNLFCPDRLDNYPPWKSRRLLGVLKALMPPHQFMTEILGTMPGLSHLLFERGALFRAFGDEFVRFPPQSVRGGTIWISLDPASGGSGPSGGSAFGVHAHVLDPTAKRLYVRSGVILVCAHCVCIMSQRLCMARKTSPLPVVASVTYAYT
jgi:hypothetical protein